MRGNEALKRDVAMTYGAEFPIPMRGNEMSRGTGSNADQLVSDPHEG